MNALRSFFARIKQACREPQSHALGRRSLGFELLENRLVPAVTYSTVNDWGSGVQGQIQIRNEGGAAITDWQVEFDYGRTIGNIWNAQIVSRQGTHYVVK